MARYAAGAVVYTSIPLVVVGLSAVTGLLPRLPEAVGSIVRLVALPLSVLFVLGLVSGWLPRPAPPAPRTIRSPVTGRWRALNSPATKVPSHGTHVYGQTYAIDLVHEPRPGARPGFGGRVPMRHPREYPAFGQPVVAPADGRVVASRDRARDHRARSNLLGFLYMIVEGMVISARGAAGPIGNRVIIALDDDSDDGTYLVLAHLQQGSVEVAVGDRVVAGQQVARVGNSGNSSEPHVHLQLMDRADANRALGRPFELVDIAITDALEATSAASSGPALPADDEVIHAGLGQR